MFIDRVAADAFWQAYRAQLPAAHPHHALEPDVFGFGGDSTLAQELADLLLAGRKRATTSLPIEYTALGEALPRSGDLSIIVRGDGQPVALIEHTSVETKAFVQVDEGYAQVEGEGDGSLSYWRRAHAEYFTRVCERLGGHFDEQTPVVCQTFRVIWTGAPRR